MKLTKLEIGLLVLAGIFFQFTAVNVNPTLGTLYIGFIVLSAVFILFDPKRTINLKKGNSSSLGALVKGAVAYVILIIGSTYIILPAIQNLKAVLSSTTPVLAQNVLLNKAIFGTGVPFVETLFFFAVLLDISSDLFNYDVTRRGLYKLKTWVFVLLISTAFLLFHLTSKGISAYDTLAVVFFMAVISMVLVLWDESYESALYFHIIANLSALIL